MLSVVSINTLPHTGHTSTSYAHNVGTYVGTYTTYTKSLIIKKEGRKIIKTNTHAIDNRCLTFFSSGSNFSYFFREWRNKKNLHIMRDKFPSRVDFHKY